MRAQLQHHKQRPRSGTASNQLQNVLMPTNALEDLHFTDQYNQLLFLCSHFKLLHGHWDLKNLFLFD
jgi:hypothetical protein